MLKWSSKLKITNIASGIQEHLIDLEKFGRFLEPLIPPAAGPTIVEFQPWRGYAGTAMVIVGNSFSEDRTKNFVEVGGQPVRHWPNHMGLITISAH